MAQFKKCINLTVFTRLKHFILNTPLQPGQWCEFKGEMFQIKQSNDKRYLIIAKRGTYTKHIKMYKYVDFRGVSCEPIDMICDGIASLFERISHATVQALIVVSLLTCVTVLAIACTGRLNKMDRDVNLDDDDCTVEIECSNQVYCSTNTGGVTWAP